MKALAAWFKNMSILTKILISSTFLAITPLLLLCYIANRNLSETGGLAVDKAQEMGKRSLESTEEIGKTAIDDSVSALDLKSTEVIELRTVELASKVADFLYERDKDIRVLAAMEPDPQRYLNVYRSCYRDVIVGEGPAETPASEVKSRNPENMQSWRHRPPFAFRKIPKPLYREITFVGLDGWEKVKVREGAISTDLRKVSERAQTYCRAEDYFQHLNDLSKGQIYVSRVIGPYVKGWLQKTPEGMKVSPESAYAGKENPAGRKFDGIIRWATPVYNAADEKIGYLTMALDHEHIMEITDHVSPGEEMFTVLPDAASGNYAFVWDAQDRSICHPRNFFICGYDPETGEEVPGWISQATYNEYLESGLGLNEFVKNLPSFTYFSQQKRGSSEQAKAGCISLDCRVLDNAPQCQGWHEGTEDGGFGSFLIYWSGLWKLTTYASIPYYRGDCGASKRGFGYVTLGANVDDFHKMAMATRGRIEKSIRRQSSDIETSTSAARDLIEASSAANRRLVTFIMLISIAVVGLVSVLISLGITRPIRRLTEMAVAMSRGDLKHSVKVTSRDEIGRLATSFNEMAAAVAEVDRMKSEFVTIASHELRTPIQAMLLGISGVLEGYSGNVDEEAREDLLLVRDGIERLIRLVRDLLDLSRIEAGKTEFKTVSFPISEAVDEAVNEVIGLAGAHNHVIVNNVPTELPPISGDRDRITQVIVNLLSNSIKYTPDGGKIVLDAAFSNGRVTVTVGDNGYGVPEWAREEIFKKFFQADSIMSQKVGGSGLGLTITRGIVEEHGGSIQCQGPPSEDRFPELKLGGERVGAVFVMTLPVNGLNARAVD